MKPIKVSPTKHSGQQGLSYRSDGTIYATAGWDAHIRVYSGRTMKEHAVLKWHKPGCYATAFAAVSPAKYGTSTKEADENDKVSTEMTNTGSAISTVQQRRDEKAQTTHWLAAGAKDGKVSLWDIY